MNYINQTMLRLATAESRAELIDDTLLSTALSIQWGAGLDRGAHEASLLLDDAELARAFSEGPRPELAADLLLRGRVEIRERSRDADAPTDPFADPRFTEEASGPTLKPGLYRVCVALLVRDAPFDLRALLYESKALAHTIHQEGLGVPTGDEVSHPVALGWVLPGRAFDDEAWPGSDVATGSIATRRAERVARANTWLAGEGFFCLLGDE